MESKGAMVAAVLASGLLHLAVGTTGWRRLDRSLHSVAVPVEVELLASTDAVPPPSVPQRRRESLPQPVPTSSQAKPRREASPNRTAAHSPRRRPFRLPSPAPPRAGGEAPSSAPEPRNEPGPGLSGQTRNTEQPNLRVSLRLAESTGTASPAEAPAVPAVPAKEEEVPEVRGGSGGSGTPQLGPRIGVGRPGLTSALGLPNPLGAPELNAPGSGKGGVTGSGDGTGNGSSASKGTGASDSGGTPGGTGDGGRGRSRSGERALPERPGAPPRTERSTTTPVVPQPAPAPKKPERAEPLVQIRARYRRNPAPDYPDEARRLRQEGVVLLRVQVSAKGRVDGVEIERSSGSPSLDQAAMRAVLRWEFEPARRGDAPVASTVTVPVRFRLDRE